MVKLYKNWHFSGDVRSPLVKKSGSEYMSLALSPDTVHVMVSYIESRGIEKYLLIFIFSHCYISFSLLLMLSKKKK
jgi:hypothetical protein